MDIPDTDDNLPKDEECSGEILQLGREMIPLHRSELGHQTEQTYYMPEGIGKVVAVSTLTKSIGDAATLKPSDEQINKLKELGVTDEQLRKAGIASGLANLTKAEAERIQVLSLSGRTRRSKNEKERAEGSKAEGERTSEGSEVMGRMGGKSVARGKEGAGANEKETAVKCNE